MVDQNKKDINCDVLLLVAGTRLERATFGL